MKLKHICNVTAIHSYDLLPHIHIFKSQTTKRVSGVSDILHSLSTRFVHQKLCASDKSNYRRGKKALRNLYKTDSQYTPDIKAIYYLKKNQQFTINWSVYYKKSIQVTVTKKISNTLPG